MVKVFRQAIILISVFSVRFHLNLEFWIKLNYDDIKIKAKEGFNGRL